MQKTKKAVVFCEHKLQEGESRLICILHFLYVQKLFVKKKKKHKQTWNIPDSLNLLYYW